MSNVVDLTNDSYQKANENTITVHSSTKTNNYTNQIADVFNLNMNNANLNMMMNTNHNVNTNGYNNSANGLGIFNTNGINNYSTYNNGQNYNIGYERTGHSAASSSSSATAATASSSAATYYLQPTALQPTTQYLYKANAIISFILLNAREFSAIADNGVIPSPTLSTLSMIPGARFDFAR